MGHFDREAFSAKVTLDVTFDGTVSFCIGAGIILLPKFSMVVLQVRLTAYFPFGGAVNDHPVSKTSATAYSPGVMLRKPTMVVMQDLKAPEPLRDEHEEFRNEL